LVSLQKIGGDCVLVIEDDGVGLPDEFDPEADGGFGFKTMRQLAARLHAQIKHLSSPLGLRTEIVFRL
jgi:two-component sensor histidine kinase